MTRPNSADENHIPTGTSRLLVVEGPEDKTFFFGLMKHLAIEQQFHIVICGGKENLSSTLTNILNDGNFHQLIHIGIICDNDFPESRQGKGALEIIQEEIDKANEGVDENIKKSRQLPKPSYPQEAAGTKPKISVLLLPDTQNDGMLESLVLEAIGNNRITNCVDRYFDCIESQAGLQLQVARAPRSRLSVYISGKITDKKYATNDDSRRWFLTQAVSMKWWQEENMWGKPAFDAAKAFLKQLLAESPQQTDILKS